MRFVKNIIHVVAIIIFCSIHLNAQNDFGASRGFSTYSKPDKFPIGNTAPITKIKSNTNQEINLNSFRGKYVLIQFWASWCKPCRMENKYLPEIYQKFKSENFVNGSGFEIYSISLDENEFNWKKAIQEDNVSAWQHVSELDGVNSKAAKDYHINAIPANFLIDGNGIIIAKSFRTHELTSILEKYVE